MKKKNLGKLVISKYKNLVVSILFDHEGKAVQINLDGGKSESLLGNIYIGRVDNIVKSINAAFIEFQPGKMGYFQLESPAEPVFTNPNRKPGPLRKGDMVMVQIAKDGIKTKEPVVSSDINLSGKYVVFTLAQKGIHFSNKFKDAEAKKEITKRYEENCKDRLGFIIRTNAAYANIDQVFEEIEFYSDIWLMLRDYCFFNPCLTQIYKAPSSYMVNIRDGYESLVGEIITDNEEIYDEIKKYLDMYQPNDIKKLKLYDNNYISLSTMYSFEKQLHDALNTKVWLKSGGYIVIEHTEALVSIDVNTGKYISEKKAEDEYLKINLEAAKEISRQILLRNLSGIIIVDFINMKSEAYKNMLLDYLRTQLEMDPLKTNVVDMTKLNLVEITRKKIRKPLYELIDLSILQ